MDIIELSDQEIYDVLHSICEDFENHLKRGGHIESAKPGGPRLIPAGDRPGPVHLYLENKKCILIEEWTPDYALGGQLPEYFIKPTEYGIKVLERFREFGKLTFLPPGL